MFTRGNLHLRTSVRFVTQSIAPASSILDLTNAVTVWSHFGALSNFSNVRTCSALTGRSDDIVKADTLGQATRLLGEILDL